MGPTGAGKSTLIKHITGSKDITIGHDLQSCTSELSITRASIVGGGTTTNVVLIDTPGFDDTNKSDLQIFQLISAWLERTFLQQIPISGVVYLHRISDNRMGGTALRNLSIFQDLCGKESFKRVILATSMWDDVEEDIRKSRMEDLKNVYWKPMIDLEATVIEFDITKASPVDILWPIIQKASDVGPLQLQSELTDLHKDLPDTEAGRQMYNKLESLLEKQKDTMSKLRADVSKAGSKQMKEVLQKELEDLTRQIQGVMIDLEYMKVPLPIRFLRFMRQALNGISHTSDILSMLPPRSDIPPLFFIEPIMHVPPLRVGHYDIDDIDLDIHHGRRQTYIPYTVLNYTEENDPNLDPGASLLPHHTTSTIRPSQGFGRYLTPTPWLKDFWRSRPSPALRSHRSPVLSSICIPRHFVISRRILSKVIQLCMIASLLLLTAVVIYGGVPETYGYLRKKDTQLWNLWSSRTGTVAGRANGVESLHAGQVGRLADTATNDTEKEMYMRFPNHVWGRGFNNVLQEALFTSYLAYVVNRTYVFEDYTWSHLPLPYTIYDFTLRPTTIPMNAFLGGPIVGQPFPSINENQLADTMAVSADYFESVCRDDDIVVVEYDYPSGSHGSNVVADVKGPREGLDAAEIADWWVWRMRRDDVRGKRCIVVSERKRKVFDHIFFGSKKVLPLFSALREAPMLKFFQWSTVVRHAVDTVAGKLMEIHSADSSPSANDKEDVKVVPWSYFPFRALWSGTPGPAEMSITRTMSPLAPGPVPGLVAIHLRRGDYKSHCSYLARHEATYMGFNQFDGALDRFEPWGDDAGDDDVPGNPHTRGHPGINDHSDVDSNYARSDYDDDDDDKDTDDIRKAMVQHYMRHCLPSIPRIVKRLRRIRADHASMIDSSSSSSHPLTHLYILSNAWPSYLSSLRDALKGDGWTDVWSTADFEGNLNKKEKGVGVAIDMALAAEKAEVFVGNGFSSLSSNIVMLRLAAGFNASTNRFI
ncbi:hypothetical protein CVT24_012841 [Panaeolus cyanescens]|uniref:G domain-containing protein n=1 Tax=Panaeolus cyanescens TaxID=181874 RepID=A0A409W6G0_9AGAR|nr:hypothetical protein CVT24_012841 [Panaeolus cyanescens]